MKLREMYFSTEAVVLLLTIVLTEGRDACASIIRGLELRTPEDGKVEASHVEWERKFLERGSK